MASLPLSQAIDEYLAWLELDRHASPGTVHGYRADLHRFSDFVGGDVGVPDIAELDRDLLRGYQRHLARARTGPKGARRLARGVTVSHETIRQWTGKFGQSYANGLRRRRAPPGDKGHPYEVFLKIN